MLSFGYCILFLRPSSQPLHLREFPSCSSGTPATETLQQEVDKIQEKGMVEIVHNQVPAFYSGLFPVEKTTGGWRPVTDLLPLSTCVALLKFKMETNHICSGIYSKGRLHVLVRYEGIVLPDPRPHKINTISSLHGE